MPISKDRQYFWRLAESDGKVGQDATSVNHTSIIGSQGGTARIRQCDAPRLASERITVGIDDGPVEKIVLRRVGEAEGPLGCRRRKVRRRLAQSKGNTDATTSLQVRSLNGDGVLAGLLSSVCDGDPNRDGTVVVDLRKGCRCGAGQSEKAGCSVGKEVHDGGWKQAPR